VDVLTQELFAGFHSTGVLSPDKCAPFSEPRGTNLGEGAGFAILERQDDANLRGAETLALVLGYGLSADAHHASAPDPSGAGVARALAAAIADSALSEAQIGYLNAHGTGTEANDPAEWRAIQRCSDRSRAGCR